jgi:hypothetical protein
LGGVRTGGEDKSLGVSELMMKNVD